MRRFLQHVLPRGFKKVRHYGFMSAKHKQTLAGLKLVLGELETEPTTEPVKTIWRPTCPVCGHEMRFVMRLAPYLARASPNEVVKEPIRA